MDYNIRDEVSGLIISPFTHEFVEKICAENGDDPLEYIQKIKEAISKKGVHYQICMNGNLSCSSKEAISKCGGTIHDTWKEAEDTWVDIQYEKGVSPFIAIAELMKMQGKELEKSNVRIVSKGC